MSEEIDHQQTVEAWDRLARTPDGLVIYRHLQRIRQAIATDHSALPHFEGRRSLAADLMAFMSEGIRAYDRACVTYTIAKPAGGASTGTAARREWLAKQPWFTDSETGDAGGAGPGANRTGNGTG